MSSPSPEGDETLHQNLADFSRRVGHFQAPLLHQEKTSLEQAVSRIGFGPGQIIVDIGSGTGNAVIPFLKAGGCAIGVELTPSMARKGLDRLNAACFSKRVVFSISRGEHSPVATGSVHAAICRNVFHHLENPLVVLKEMTRIVEKGGHVIIEDFYEPDSDEERMPLHTIDRLRVPSHVRTLSMGEFRALFHKAGISLTHLIATAKRQRLSEWLDQGETTDGNMALIRMHFEKLLRQGGGWWDVESEGNDYIFSHKRITIIGRKP